jgi:hypothetical protein
LHSRRPDAATVATRDPRRRRTRQRRRAAAGTSGTSRGPRKLVGTVGSTEDPDAYEITLTSEDGAEVTTILPPGEYRLETNALSTIHNFHLRGRYAGADVVTDVAGTGEKTAIVLLNEPESYIYYCDAHPARMNAIFSIHDRIRTQN